MLPVTMVMPFLLLTNVARLARRGNQGPGCHRLRTRAMGDDNPDMTIEEVIEHIMRATGKTRRQARYALYEAARSGKLRATGINPDTMVREAIPPEAWPKVH